jgi:2-keto-3-deoxy-L-rhamnonate aldolase RhmA
MESSNIFKIKEKLLKNQIPIGTHLRTGNPIIADILCNCGFDFIWIEAEHSLIDNRDICMSLITIKNAGLSPFIRVTGLNSNIIKPVLDMGIEAIIFPLVKTVEEAKLAVSNCRYPPGGIRGFGPIKADVYSIMDIGDYIERSKKEPWVILQIEHIEGVNNLEKIIKVEGVGSIVIGSNDLSGSLGLLGQTKHSKVLKAQEKIAAICKQSNLPFGVSIGDWTEEDIDYWISLGVSWISLGTDISYILNGGKNTLKTTKKMIKKIKG